MVHSPPDPNHKNVMPAPFRMTPADEEWLENVNRKLAGTGVTVEVRPPTPDRPFHPRGVVSVTVRYEERAGIRPDEAVRDAVIRALERVLGDLRVDAVGLAREAV